MGLQEGIQSIWSSDYVQKNPNKAYKVTYANEYSAVAAFLNGGAEPSNWQSFSKMGKGLVEVEIERRKATQPGPGPGPEPTPGTEPAPIAGQGYRKVFDDNFDTLDTSVWRLQNWYLPEEPSDVFVSNGIMNVMSRQSEGNPPRGAMTKRGWQFGYFETRLRWTANVNAFPAFWMMSENWITTGNCNTLKISEFDIFEAFQTGYPRMHSGALHRNTTGQCGLPDQLQHIYTMDTGKTLAGEWHIYSGLWTPTNVTWYVDEQSLGTRPVFDTTSQPMRLFLQMGSHAGAGIDLVSEYDWVRVWQK